MSLTVSDAARQEDRAAEKAKDMKLDLKNSKNQILEKLTKQMQQCIARVQSGGLDENSCEKYQDLIMKLKLQMGKITGEPAKLSKADPPKFSKADPAKLSW